MEELRVTLDNGKYEVVFDSNSRLYALRHGEKWRDLLGDNLILCMLQRIVELEKQASKVEEEPKEEAIDRRFSFNCIPKVLELNRQIAEVKVEIDKADNQFLYRELSQKQRELETERAELLRDAEKSAKNDSNAVHWLDMSRLVGGVLLHGDALSRKASNELDRIAILDGMSKINDEVKSINEKIALLGVGSKERVALISLQLELEKEKLELMKELEKIVENTVENQGVEQGNDPFFRLVSEDSHVAAIQNLLSQMTTLSTGMTDERWVADTDGLILGDGILSVHTGNPKDTEFYASAVDMVLYLTHEVARLREGYRFLGDPKRSQKNIDINSPDDFSNFLVSVQSMALNNLKGTSHNGEKRKFFAYGKELPQ